MVLLSHSPLGPASRHPDFAEGTVSIQTNDGTTILSLEQARRCQSVFLDGLLESYGLLEKPSLQDTVVAQHLALALPQNTKVFKQLVCCMQVQKYTPPSHWCAANQELFAEYLALLAPRPYTAAIAAAERARLAAIEAAKAIPPGFVRIEAGEFTMGSPADEAGRFDDEVLHQVRLTRAYFMQTHLVTQGQWQALMGNNPSHFNADGPNGELAADRPVETISLYDMWAYCNARSLKEGLPAYYNLAGFTGEPGTGNYRPPAAGLNPLPDVAGQGHRLPSEAEWEKAARSGASDARHGELDAIAWHSGNAAHRTHPVGTKAANAAGIYDVLGNVYERVDDVYSNLAGVQQNEVTVDPRGPAANAGTDWLVRGGCWGCTGRDVRLALRGWYAPAERGSGLGFRSVRFVPLAPEPLDP